MKLLKNNLLALFICISTFCIQVHADESPLSAFEAGGNITYIDLGTNRIEIDEQRFEITDKTKVRTLSSSDSISVYNYPLEKGMVINYVSTRESHDNPPVISEIMITDN